MQKSSLTKRSSQAAGLPAGPVRKSSRISGGAETENTAAASTTEHKLVGPADGLSSVPPARRSSRVASGAGDKENSASADQKPSLADSALNTDVDGQPQRRSRRLASRSTSELESQASSGSSCSTEAMALGACSIDDRSPSSDSSSVSLSLSMAAPAASASAPAVLITPPKAPIDWSDNIFFSTYDSDLSVHNRESEKKKRVPARYMDHQPDINSVFRSILIDWLLEVHRHNKQQPETLHLAVSILDRYLATIITPRAHLQLVGCTALLLASKHEETFHRELSVGKMVYVCDGVYSPADVREMETRILSGLDFRLSAPTAFTFATRLLKAAGPTLVLRDPAAAASASLAPMPSSSSSVAVPAAAGLPSGAAAATSSSASSSSLSGVGSVAAPACRLAQLTMFLLDSTLPAYDSLRFLPSELAAASVNIALRSLSNAGRAAWTPAMEAVSGYSEASLRTAIRFVEHVARNGTGTKPVLFAVQDKYVQPRAGSCFLTPLAIFDGLPPSSLAPVQFRAPILRTPPTASVAPADGAVSSSSSAGAGGGATASEGSGASSNQSEH